MKKLLTILIFLISFVFSYGQVITTNTPGAVPRSNKATKAVEDFNLAARTNFFVPRMDDTTQANTNATMDTCGRLVYTYDVDGYWYRRCTPSRHWERVGGSASVILPQCGIANGTGIVTWDSLLVFDVTASLYALCCDNVARVTPDTVIVLPPSDPDNPRIDAIVLTRNGIEIDTGIAQANPALPQLDSCELLLTYVLINAGETVPAFVTPNNPLSIYDENYTTEWIIDSIHNITMDTADVTFPVHLTKDIKITSYTVTDNFFEFHTDSTINLNDYGALKLYIRSPASNGPIRVFFTWYLDGQQQTISQFTQSLPAMASPVYNIIVVPISNFSTLSGASTSVNNLRINISGGSTTFYIDWIQLQSGIPAPASPTGIQSFSSGNLSPLFNTQVAINGSQIVQSFIQQPAGSYTVLSNRTNISGSYSFGKIDLSTPVVTGLLPIINLAPSVNNGDFVQTIGGNSTWVTLTSDTTFVGNGLMRRPIVGSNNDSLLLGWFLRDTAKLIKGTFLSLNSTSLTFNQGATDIFKLNSNGTNGFLTVGASRFEEAKGANVTAANNLTLGNDGNVFTITGNTQINAITTANWQAGSQVELIFTGTPTVKNNTAGGAGTATLLLEGGIDFVAAANDVLSLIYDGTNWLESARKTTSGATTQTLQQTFNTEVGGSVLTKLDSIEAGIYGIFMTASRTGFAEATLNVENTGGAAGSAIRGVASNGYAILGQSTSGVAIAGLSGGGSPAVYGDASGTGPGVWGQNDLGQAAGLFTQYASSTNTVTNVLRLERFSTGTGADGIGGSIDFYISSSLGGELSNQLISKYTTANSGTRISQFKITGVNSAVARDLATFSSNAGLVLNGSLAVPYTAQTGTYAILATDYTVECTSGTFTATLPTAVGITGRIYFITNSGAGTITLATTSSQTFANVVATPTTLTIATLTGVVVQSNGANWLKVSSF